MSFICIEIWKIKPCVYPVLVLCRYYPCYLEQASPLWHFALQLFHLQKQSSNADPAMELLCAHHGFTLGNTKAVEQKER